MEISWNFVSLKKWEPCPRTTSLKSEVRASSTAGSSIWVLDISTVLYLKYGEGSAI